MSKKEKNIQGQELFNNFYQSIYQQRWQCIKDAFEKEVLYHKFTIKNHNVPAEEEYFLDKASFFAASQLPLDNAKNILDMCAAPGGKSLVIASRMNKDATLICNERSADRRNRLIKNINIQLPEEIKNRINVTGYDGAMMCQKERDKFDAIFLDAPCSSERHVYNSITHLLQWSNARTKNLSFTQWSLLSSAFLMLKQNGYLVYATCSLSPYENDTVIKKLLKKYSCAAVVNELNEFDNEYFNDIFIEKTQYGFSILPDKSNGAGPIYFSLVKKLNIK